MKKKNKSLLLHRLAFELHVRCKLRTATTLLHFLTMQTTLRFQPIVYIHAQTGYGRQPTQGKRRLATSTTYHPLTLLSMVI